MQERVGVLVGTKGRGSNLAALARAGVPISVVVGTDSSAPARALATSLGLQWREVPFDEEFESGLFEAFAGCKVVCLAGFLRLLPERFTSQFNVLNIHPSLLPAYGGKGMYGIHVHRAVLEAGEKESGCTVHRVTAEYDEGEIVLQGRCPVLPDDTPETLAARVLDLEHKIYPQAVFEVLGGG